MKKLVIILGMAGLMSIASVCYAVANEKCYDMEITIDCGGGKKLTTTVSGHNIREIAEEAMLVANDFCS